MPRIMRQTTSIVALLGTMSILLLVACGGEANPGYTPVASASISPSHAIPIPTETPVLTISGKIAAKNAGDTLVFDIPTLEKLGLVEYTVNDAWLKQSISYSGVLMSDLLKFAGTFHTATTVHLVALDDYEVDIPIADIQKWPILLATKADNEYMTVENYGPTRIIYPYDTHPVDPVAHNDLWIWSIQSIDVR